jgi:hypothetical protein
MKFIIILLLISNIAIAEQFEFNRMDSFDDFELKFLLTSDTAHDKQAVLDCQSFINKFDFFDDQGQLKYENFININMCEQIYINTMKCFDNNENKCFDSDDILDQNCLCDQ